MASGGRRRRRERLVLTASRPAEEEQTIAARGVADDPSAREAPVGRADRGEPPALGGAPGLSLPPLDGAGRQMLDWLALPASADPRVRRETRRLNELALTKVAAKDFVSAIELLRRVVNFTPDSPAAHGNLGIALWQAGRAAESEAHCRRAISLNADYVPAHMILANLLRARRAFAEALACYNRVVSVDPGNAVAHNNAGLLLRVLGDFAQAETAFARAADLIPDDPRIRFNQLMMRRDDASLPEAIECCRRSLERHPDSADVLTNLAVALQLHGQFEQSLANYDKALAIDPNQHDAHFNLSLLLLLRGDYARGWREYEHRWHLTEITKPDYAEPIWEGERLDGRTILLQAEQGFGDAIQFLRYVPAVAQRGGRIVLRLERAVVRLAASLPGDIMIKPADARLPKFDVWCPLLSLPRILNTRLESIPAAIPYLAPRAAIAARWQRTLAATAGLKVGLAWAGNPRHVNDLRRSIGIDQLPPLVEIAGVGFVSLQVGPHAADLARLPAGSVADLSPQLTDFAETAAAIANLDLVITVDTVVAHLAGAIGKPAWVMLPFSPDWRWMLERDDSPWYPTLRLFRQPKLGDWDSVIARVAADLRQRAAACAHGAVASPTDRHQT
jgi:tetratricopeptide (TPR) repeat protein